MTNADSFPGWSWGSPEECTKRLDDLRASGARCEKLKLLDCELPLTRLGLRNLGITGIEYAAFKTAHPSGLAADYLSVRSEDAATEPGLVYLLDGTSYFMQLDISAAVPFEDACFDWVYAQHLIEHVEPDAGVGWLAEIHRTLMPGGLLRLTTPDLRKYAESYLSGRGFFAEHRQRVRLLVPGHAMPQRPAFMLNQIFNFYGHRWIYDADELTYALSCAGFDPAAVRVCRFRRGERADIAALDSSVRND